MALSVYQKAKFKAQRVVKARRQLEELNALGATRIPMNIVLDLVGASKRSFPITELRLYTNTRAITKRTITTYRPSGRSLDPGRREYHVQKIHALYKLLDEYETFFVVHILVNSFDGELSVLYGWHELAAYWAKDMGSIPCMIYGHANDVDEWLIRVFTNHFAKEM